MLHQRFSLNGERGTVKWRGTLQDLPWLGIEWDDARRGKHSGLYQDTQLFECKQAGAGSFLKRDKLKKDPSQTLSQALQNKYQDTGTLHAQSIMQGVTRQAEQVGFERAQERYANLQSLRLVALEGCRIDKLDAVDLPRCEDLDLSRNLVDNLDEVARLCQQLPQLQRLRLEGNRFKEQVSIELHTETLHLGNTLSSWDLILSLCNQWHVKHLFLEHNQLQDPPATVGQAIMVSSIELAGNAITDVLGITRCFPNLQSLSLSSNQVSTLAPASNAHPLTRLALEHNPLDVGQLVHLPFTNLAELSMTQLADPDADLARRLTILRLLPTLRILNRTRVTEQERQDAVIVQAPPRAFPILADDLVQLTLVWEAGERPVQVLQTQTILQMRNLVKRIVGRRPRCAFADEMLLKELDLISGARLCFQAAD